MTTSTPLHTTPTTRSRAPRLPAVDSLCAAAVELARAAAEEEAGSPARVGEHVGVVAEGERLVTHRFASRTPGYLDWQWAVTVARASRAKAVTLCESVLLPGEDALLAPAWVPWHDRLRPGDVGAGDLLPSHDDDERLDPGWGATATGDSALGDGPDVEGEDAVLRWELGLGRARVLSALGRDDAVDRWYSGTHGPTAPVAEAAPAPCSECGFFLPLAGAVRRIFGVCANEYSPSDGQVVSLDHGCGAHSEVVVSAALPELSEHLLDEVRYDAFPLPGAATVLAASGIAGHPPGSVDDRDEQGPAEELGHS